MSVIERWIQRVLLMLAVPLVLYASYICAQLTWLVITPNAQVQGQADGNVQAFHSRSQNSGQSLLASFNPSTIARWHLFGRETAPAVATAVAKKPAREIKAPDTKLKLELVGVFVADQEEDSTAIIASKGRGDESEVYAIGDSVSGGATLEHVYEDRVLLSRRGQMETLRFPEESSSGLDVAQRRASSARLARVAPPQADNFLPDEGFGQQVQLAMSMLGLEPSGAGGGYVVTSSAPPDILNRLPVSVGDRILSVNGNSLGDPGQDQGIFESLMGEQSVQIEIERGQARMTVDVNIADFIAGQ